ncbi:MAG: hypothetical protein ACRCYU_06185 [Nocardioides sp.]
MTDRLTELLELEAADVRVSAAPVADILTEGRRLRRRQRRATTVLLAVTVAITSVGGAGTWRILERRDQGSPADSAIAASRLDVPVFGIGSTVYLGDVIASAPGTVRSLHYTSAGVLVRSSVPTNAEKGDADGSGLDALSLVTANGGVTNLDVIGEGTAPVTDPDEPVFVLPRQAGGGLYASVYLATTGARVGRVALSTLPVAGPSPGRILGLDGDVLYAGNQENTVAVNWRTGQQRPIIGAEGIVEVRGGRAVIDGRNWSRVINLNNSSIAATVPLRGYTGYRLSPDGQLATAVIEPEVDLTSTPPLWVYDVGRRRLVDLEKLPSRGYGWTAGGDPFWITANSVVRCYPRTRGRACVTDPLPSGVRVDKDADVRLGGIDYRD